MKRFYILLLLVSSANLLYAQDDLSKIFDDKKSGVKEYASATFKGYRVINAQTNETTKKHNLEFMIAHRFGDIGGNNGGAHTLYGFDNSSDIRFSFDYGITDRLQVGVGRAKGIEPMFELYDGNVKFKLLRQTTDNKMPISVALFGDAAISGRKQSTDTLAEGAYPKTIHRWSYVSQIVIARKFSPSLSVELVPSWVHLNYVAYNDFNDIYSLGVAARMKITKRFALIADYFYTIPVDGQRPNLKNGDFQFFDPIGLGIEIETGGHVFTIQVTNSMGITENEVIPYTRSDWSKGEFRLGFNISRNFALSRK